MDGTASETELGYNALVVSWLCKDKSDKLTKSVMLAASEAVLSPVSCPLGNKQEFW